MSDVFDEIHLLLKKKAYDEALQLLLDSNTNNVQSRYDVDANHAWYIIGDIFYKKAEYGLATDAFKKALAHWPNDLDAMIAVGNCYSENEMLNEAENFLRESKKLFPASSTITYNLANSLFDQGKYLAAIKMYETISSEDEIIFNSSQKNIVKAKKKLGKKV
ncbi:hypothetical protein ACO0LM_23250 [Undibacterium sp. Di26W]|uniref:hypothetical protein n=1 Tax=Undibacterium sp. Di26W TaxID=3413035 RepID=UPI003BF0DEEF